MSEKTVEGYASIHTVTSSDPQGTLAELLAHNMRPNAYGSCAKRKPDGDDTVLGCPWWNKCQFTRHKGVDGPINVGVAVVLSPDEGAYADGKVMPCFHFYGSGLADRARQAMLNGTGEIIRVIAEQGDGKKIKERTSERLHIKPDPGCLDCKNPNVDCIKMHEPVAEREVPRLARMWENTGMAYGQELRAEMLRDLRAQADQQTLEQHARMGSGLDAERAQ